ncbi:MAG: ankyrin repeat domain-containing protein, partial [Candidatus Omnitrophica bacterium]|nr:ankyrin repeat domain-containing protein [Candidatus Omnitrophota bacterium]
MQYSSFQQIVRDQNLEVLRSLLEKDPSLANRKDEFEGTPLHMAVSVGNADIVTLLLEHGARVDTQSKYHRTPLHIAAFEG